MSYPGSWTPLSEPNGLAFPFLGYETYGTGSYGTIVQSYGFLVGGAPPPFTDPWDEVNLTGANWIPKTS